MALLNSLKMSRVQLAVINRLLQIRLPKSTSFLHFHYGPSSTASLAQKAQEHNSKLKHRLFGVQQSAACCQGRNSFCSWIVIPSHPPSSLVPPSLNGLPQICLTFLATVLKNFHRLQNLGNVEFQEGNGNAGAHIKLDLGVDWGNDLANFSPIVNIFSTRRVSSDSARISNPELLLLQGEEIFCKFSFWTSKLENCVWNVAAASSASPDHLK